jgi:hypothetical protein
MRKSQLLIIWALFFALFAINQFFTNDSSRRYFGGLPWYGWAGIAAFLLTRILIRLDQSFTTAHQNKDFMWLAITYQSIGHGPSIHLAQRLGFLLLAIRDRSKNSSKHLHPQKANEERENLSCCLYRYLTSCALQ